eukprot:2904252-Rhodomonas_salina.2
MPSGPGRRLAGGSVPELEPEGVEAGHGIRGVERAQHAPRSQVRQPTLGHRLRLHPGPIPPIPALRSSEAQA